jgi:hypothetical protein
LFSLTFCENLVIINKSLHFSPRLRRENEAPAALDVERRKVSKGIRQKKSNEGGRI